MSIATAMTRSCLRPLEAHVDGARDSKGQGQNIYLEALRL